MQKTGRTVRHTPQDADSSPLGPRHPSAGDLRGGDVRAMPPETRRAEESSPKTQSTTFAEYQARIGNAKRTVDKSETFLVFAQEFTGAACVLLNRVATSREKDSNHQPALTGKARSEAKLALGAAIYWAAAVAEYQGWSLESLALEYENRKQQRNLK